MSYIRKSDKKFIIERTWQTYDSRHTEMCSKIREIGLSFISEFYHSTFYGTRYIIDMPYGKGMNKKLDLLYAL